MERRFRKLRLASKVIPRIASAKIHELEEPAHPNSSLVQTEHADQSVVEALDCISDDDVRKLFRLVGGSNCPWQVRQTLKFTVCLLEARVNVLWKEVQAMAKAKESPGSNFLADLKAFSETNPKSAQPNKGNIPQHIIHELKSKYTQREDYRPEKVASKFKPAQPLCAWLHAIVLYHDAYHTKEVPHVMTNPHDLEMLQLQLEEFIDESQWRAKDTKRKLDLLFENLSQQNYQLAWWQSRKRPKLYQNKMNNQISNQSSKCLQ